MKIFVSNRKNQKLAVIIEQPVNPQGLAIVMHGLGGFKEQPHIETFATAFLDNKYTTVRFDVANTIGESEGKMEEATTTSYYEDLEDIIAWSKKQSWYQEPFILVGHSLGAGCSLLYAEHHPQEIKAIAPISTVVSGKLSFESYDQEELDEWQKTGWQITESRAKPGVFKKLPWSHMEDRLKYDLLTKVDQLTMPVLLIVGEDDTSTPVKHQQILLDKLPGPKELRIIKNAPHTFRESKHLNEIKQILNNWIKNYERR